MLLLVPPAPIFTNGVLMNLKCLAISLMISSALTSLLLILGAGGDVDNTRWTAMIPASMLQNFGNYVAFHPFVFDA